MHFLKYFQIQKITLGTYSVPHTVYTVYLMRGFSTLPGKTVFPVFQSYKKRHEKWKMRSHRKECCECNEYFAKLSYHCFWHNKLHFLKRSNKKMFSQVIIIAMFATLFSSSAFHLARSTKASTRSMKMVVVDPDVPGQIAPTGLLPQLISNVKLEIQDLSNLIPVILLRRRFLWSSGSLCWHQSKHFQEMERIRTEAWSSGDDGFSWDRKSVV